MAKYFAKVGHIISIPKKSGTWVVEEAEMTGGGYAQAMDYYPDSWHVIARKLDKDGSYNPKGRKTTFTQNTNCYNTVIEGVKKVGQKKRVVEFV